MTNQPSWVAGNATSVRVRSRAKPVETSVRTRSRPEPQPQKLDRRWPNGSGVFVRSSEPRKPFRPDEEQPGFLGRVVHEGKTYRVYRWSPNGYADIGTCDGFSEALIRLGGKR